MEKKFYKVSDLYNSGVIPIARSLILKLIKNGELKKIGELQEGEDYLIAVNVGIGKKNASWVVYSEDIEKWKQRALKKPILSDNAS